MATTTINVDKGLSCVFKMATGNYVDDFTNDILSITEGGNIEAFHLVFDGSTLKALGNVSVNSISIQIITSQIPLLGYPIYSFPGIKYTVPFTNGITNTQYINHAIGIFPSTEDLSGIGTIYKRVRTSNNSLVLSDINKMINEDDGYINIFCYRDGGTSGGSTLLYSRSGFTTSITIDYDIIVPSTYKPRVQIIS